MRNRNNIILSILIIACLAVFFGYRVMDGMRTDTTPPEIEMTEQIPELSVSDPQSMLLQGITAKDKRDGDVTGSLVVEGVDLLDNHGRLMVRYAAFDAAGNVVKAQREAQYTDYHSPRFTMNGALVYNMGSNFDVLKTVGAEDLLDGDIQHRVRATLLDAESIAERGTHDVQFQVTNSLGDTVTQVFQVDVLDPNTYDATLDLKKYVVYLNVGDTFRPSDYLEAFTLRGVTTNLRNGLPQNYDLRVQGNVQTQTPGAYPVEYRVTYTIRHDTDPTRDQKFTAYSKLYVIVEG